MGKEFRFWQTERRVFADKLADEERLAGDQKGDKNLGADLDNQIKQVCACVCDDLRLLLILATPRLFHAQDLLHLSCATPSLQTHALCLHTHRHETAR